MLHPIYKSTPKQEDLEGQNDPKKRQHRKGVISVNKKKSTTKNSTFIGQY